LAPRRFPPKTEELSDELDKENHDKEDSGIDLLSDSGDADLQVVELLGQHDLKLVVEVDHLLIHVLVGKLG
jgi:hypothetical protein